MPGSRNTGFWRVLRPSAWPRLPSWMSFSTLIELETCPRRWALTTAEYPNLWKYPGYPSLPHQSALEGTVVHLSLKKITDALAEGNCPSLRDERAMLTLRELGGYTAIIMGSLDRALVEYEENPRVAPTLDTIRKQLADRAPEFRTRVQRFLSRICLQPRAVRPGETAIQRKGASRHPLPHGSHAEVLIQASELGWRGVADLLILSSERCEIRDFKTGASKQEHDVQLRTYALLWARDRDLNPVGRPADRLVLSYDSGDSEVPAPSDDELRSLEDELRGRTVNALAHLKPNPPEAQPGPEKCVYCPVRHLCEDYWNSHARLGASNESAKVGFGDIQIKLCSQHGPRSWNGLAEFCPSRKVGGSLLLRTTDLQVDLYPGQRVRLLNVYISVPEGGPTEDGLPAFVATMGANSEAFLLAT